MSIQPMPITKESNQTTESIDFLSETYAKLDDLGHDELCRAITGAIEEQGGITLDIADRMDRLFTVKLLRLLRTPTIPTDALQQLDELIARLSRDRHREALDALPSHFASRWRALRDVIITSLQIDAYHDALARTPASQPTSAWEVVASMVVDAGIDGIPWSIVANAVIANKCGPCTKGGVSQLVTAMRAHGWVDAIPRGRSKLLVPGKNIAKSQAWQQRYGAIPVQSGKSESMPLSTTTSSQKLTEVARQAVSLNQGAFLDFGHLAHERHRKLRIAVGEGPLVRISEHRKNKIQELAAELISFMNDRLTGVALQNFELLKNHFDNRSDVAPRVCIKGNWRLKPDAVSIKPIIRDSPVDYDAIAALRDNTGFFEVIETGTYYLNNDIARAALQGRYRNPRFNYSNIQNLQNRLDMSDVANGRGLTSETWLSCWRDSGQSDTRRYYRSTLIVPLTLRNKNLSKEFRVGINDRIQGLVAKNMISRTLGSTDYNRSILGFLCLDHPDANYFCPDQDVNTAHIFADLLSMYVFTLITLTTLSKTYRHAVTAMGKDHMNALQQQMKARLSSRRTPYLPPSLELGKTIHNMLLNLPEIIETQDIFDIATT